MAMLGKAAAGPAVQRASPTGDHDANRPMSPQEAARSSKLAVQPGVSAAMGKDQQATPEEQEEYTRASEVVEQAFYEGETADGIVEMLNPQEKVGSVAKASILAFTTLDNQHDFDEVIMADLAMEVTGRVIELYEASQGEEFSEPEEQAALGSAWEGLMEAYGVTPEDYADLTQGMGEKDIDAYEQEYQGFVKGASTR